MSDRSIRPGGVGAAAVAAASAPRLTPLSPTRPRPAAAAAAAVAVAPAQIAPHLLFANALDVSGAFTGSTTAPADVEALTGAVRRHLPGLGADEAQRYERMLTDILQTGDRSKQPQLLRPLVAAVVAAVRRQRVHAQHPRLWQALSRTTAELRFDRMVARLSREKEAELLTLRAQILRLPTLLRSVYQNLMDDILASDDLAKRDVSLRRMRTQLDAELPKDSAPNRPTAARP